MNSLSWMLYAADVVGNIGFVLGATAIGAGIGGVIAVIGSATKEDFANIRRPEGAKVPALKAGWERGKGFFLVALIAAAVGTPIPSPDTVYAIAASEMGEDVLNSETGGKAIKALDAWLDRQIEGEPS